jgi:hypothetical protein
MLLFVLTFCWALLFAPVLSSRTPKHGISSGFPHKKEVHLEQYLPRDVGTIGTVRTAVSHRSGSFVFCTRRRHCLLRCAVSLLAVRAFPSYRYLRQANEAQWKTEKYGTFLVLRSLAVPPTSVGMRKLGWFASSVKLAYTQLPDLD